MASGRAHTRAGTHRSSVAYAVVAALSLGCGGDLPQVGAGFPESLEPMTDLALVDHHGRAFDLSRLDDRWSLVTFGYTHCPDVCPAALAVAGSAIDEVEAGPADADPTLVFVSVDPARDDVERLRAYIPFFGDRVLGVTGPADQIARLERAFGVGHRLGEPDPRGSYPVSHSGLVFVVGPNRHVWERIEPPLTRDALLESLDAARRAAGHPRATQAPAREENGKTG